MARAQAIVHNRLLRSLSPKDKALLAPNLEAVSLMRGEVLFEPGQDVVDIYFPGRGAVASLILNSQGRRER